MCQSMTEGGDVSNYPLVSWQHNSDSKTQIPVKPHHVTGFCWVVNSALTGYIFWLVVSQVCWFSFFQSLCWMTKVSAASYLMDRRSLGLTSSNTLWVVQPWCSSALEVARKCVLTYADDTRGAIIVYGKVKAIASMLSTALCMNRNLSKQQILKVSWTSKLKWNTN